MPKVSVRRSGEALGGGSTLLPCAPCLPGAPWSQPAGSINRNAGSQPTLGILLNRAWSTSQLPPEGASGPRVPLPRGSELAHPW